MLLLNESKPRSVEKPLNSIEKGAILELEEYCRKHAFNFQTHLEGENTFVITVEY